MVPLAWGCRSAPGTFEDDVPQTQVISMERQTAQPVSPGATRKGGGGHTEQGRHWRPDLWVPKFAGQLVVTSKSRTQSARQCL